MSRTGFGRNAYWLKTLLEQEPDNEQAKAAYETCKRTAGRPNQEDIDDACDFVREKLDI